MWYEAHTEKKLDFSKPIFARSDGNLYILLPKQEKGSYKLIGYNWFNILKGDWNSCVDYETPQKAIDSYGHCKIFNGEIEIEIKEK